MNFLPCTTFVESGQTGLLENDRKIFVFVLSVICTLLSDVEKLLTTNYFTKKIKNSLSSEQYNTLINFHL